MAISQPDNSPNPNLVGDGVSLSSPIITLRAPCPKCSWIVGVISVKNGQNVARCSECDAYQYSVPKTETGQKRTTASSARTNLKPKKRYFIIERAGGVCELCHGRDRPLQVGHIISVADGLGKRMKVAEINSEANLYALCDECNLGQGKKSLPSNIAAAIVAARNLAQN